MSRLCLVLMVAGALAGCAEAHERSARGGIGGPPEDDAFAAPTGAAQEGDAPVADTREQAPVPARPLPTSEAAAPAAMPPMQPKPVPERRVELCELRIIDTDESGFEPGDPGRCAFRMYAKPPRAKLLRVFVGGGEREHGRTDDGWVYDPTSATVTLLGAACEEANGSTTVRIESQCETLKLI